MAIDDDSKIRPQANVADLPAHGVWAPACTPVAADLTPDSARFADHVRWLLGNGCHGVVVFGTTGEAPSFSTDERMALLDATLAAGLPPDRLIVGTGCPALTDTVRLSAQAVAAGCAGVLVVPPFYFKAPAEDGIFASYSEIIERTGTAALRLFLYHFPRLSGVPITPALVERLCARYPGVVAGIKDSSGDWDGTQDFLGRFPDLAIFPGSETFLLPGLAAGGAGCITATANINPAAIRAVFDAWQDDHRSDGTAAGLQDGISATRRVIEAYPLAPALKFLLARGRGDPDWGRVRPPMVALDEAAGRELGSALQADGFSVPKF